MVDGTAVDGTAVDGVSSEAQATERAHALALQLLERHGILTREAVASEAVPGAFAGLYRILDGLESRGHVRRGYFVAGLGAAQFALPGAVDRLRAQSDGADQLAPFVLAATDPAQPFGAALPWPETASSARPARAAGAFVVIRDGQPLVTLERGGRSIARFPAAFDDHSWAASLAAMVKNGRLRSLEIAKVDGVAVREKADALAVLKEAGFIDSYRGVIYRG